MSERSRKILITNEARVLRAFRVKQGLSMKKAGALAGISASLIAHTETGRVNPPQGKALTRLLKAYGGITEKAFYDRVRSFHDKAPPHQELYELIDRANPKQIQTLLRITKGILS